LLRQRWIFELRGFVVNLTCFQTALVQKCWHGSWIRIAARDEDRADLLHIRVPRDDSLEEERHRTASHHDPNIVP
jgi:hypothetical protein